MAAMDFLSGAAKLLGLGGEAPDADDAPATPEDLLPSEGPNSAAAWQTRIREAQDLQKFHRDTWYWTRNVDRYAGKGGDDPLLPSTNKGRVALLPKDYSYTEQKKPLLFYQLPEILASPKRDDVPALAAQTLAAYLNDLTGQQQLNALATVSEVLTDVLVASGIGAVKVGYETFVHPTQPEILIEEPVVDPLTGQPAVDPMTGQPQTRQRPVPNIVRERYFLDRISPLDFLYDASFRGSDWGKCAWMGWKGRMPAHAAARAFRVPEDEIERLGDTGSMAPTAEQSLAPDRQHQRLAGVEYVELYYRAIEFDEAAADPDHIKRLVFLQGRSDPVLHEDCPCQTVENGVVARGLRRPPIFPLTIRYVPDQAVPPSDCAMGRVLTDELSRGRTQMWEQRDRNVPLRGIDLSKVTPETRAAFLNGKVQEVLGFENVENPEKAIFGIQQSAFPQEDFNFNNIGERDLQECWGMSSHNLGTPETSGRTATELSLRQQGTETRMATEQARVELWWLTIVEALATMVQEYTDLPQWTKVVGPQNAQQFVQWTKQDIAGEFAFTLRPDSAKRVDQTAERKFRLDTFNLFANVPGINKGELIKWVAPTLGLDPGKLYAEPQPAPEPPKISLTIATDSLSPLSPEFANVAAILQSRGIELTPATPPGGAAPSPGVGAPGGGPVQAAGGVPPVNKHAADLTGRLDGAGAAQSAPMGR